MQEIEFKQKNNFWNGFWTVIWLVLLVLLVLKFVVYQQVTVVGKSMMPNYEDGQLLLVNQLKRGCERGQVVAVYEDESVAKNADYFTRFSARFFLKRCIGLPGEEIEIVGSKVIIYNTEYPNGAILEEDYIPEVTKLSEQKRKFYYPKTKIATGHYFVMGDNRSNSTDSRSRGSFADFAIFGQESIRFWPINNLDAFELPKYRFLPITKEVEDERNQLKEVYNQRNRLEI